MTKPKAGAKTNPRGVSLPTPVRVSRQYTAEQRLEAVALALSIGPLRAAKQLGLPVTTVSEWRRGRRRAHELQPIVQINREEMAEKLWSTLTRAVKALESRLDDPGARLGDVARATEVLLTSHQLLSGQATSRSEVIDSMTVEQARGVDAWATAMQRQAAVMESLTPERREALWQDIVALYRTYFGADFAVAVMVPPGLVEPAAPVAEPPPSADDIRVLRAWLDEQDRKAAAP